MKKKFKASLAVLAATMCAASLVGCGDKGASGDVYKIGGIGPLTGDASSYGISVKQGSQIAIDEINGAGGVNGKKLELVFEDDVNDPEKAVSAYNKVMDQGIVALVGGVTSGCSIAVSDESVSDGILQITPSGSAQDCTKQPNSFRICFTDPLQGQTMAKYIADNGYKNVAVIYDVADEYSKGVKTAFVEEAANVGLTVVAEESFTGGDIDFKTQLTKIKGTNADCIFLPIYYAEVAAISQQAASVGLSLPYFGADGWDGVIDQLEGDTTNINGAVFLTPFVATSEKENVKTFVAEYEKAYKETPDQFAADGYDAVYAIKAALEVCGDDVTNENLVAAMTKIEVKGVTGDMTFTAEGEPNKSAAVATIQDGKYVAK